MTSNSKYLNNPNIFIEPYQQKITLNMAFHTPLVLPNKLMRLEGLGNINTIHKHV